MNKYLLGLSAITVLFSPILLADTTNQTPPITTAPQSITSQSGPSTPDTTAPNTPATMPDTLSTDATTPVEATTDSTTTMTSVDVQLKTMSGAIVPTTIDSANLQGIKVGDQLTVTSVGTTTPNDSNATTTNDTIQ
jgi:hypothetical protein